MNSIFVFFALFVYERLQKWFKSANQLERKRRGRKYAQVCYQLVPARTPFAPASQQRIKRLKPTNTRLKQQFEEFWEPKKLQRGAGRFSAPPPFVVFSATQNCSDWCLSLVFVGLQGRTTKYILLSLTIISQNHRVQHNMLYSVSGGTFS